MLWLILIFVDFGLMFVSFPILIYVIFSYDMNTKMPSVSALVLVKRPEGAFCMYATVYACIRRNTSKILPSCYCLKPVVKIDIKYLE